MNLVTNAAEAIGEAEGTVTGSLGLRAWARPGRGRLAGGLETLSPGPSSSWKWWTRGTGMDTETRARIFDPMLHHLVHGPGAGPVAACRGIVRSHGGGVGIQSRPGAGTGLQGLPAGPERDALPPGDAEPAPVLTRPGRVSRSSSWRADDGAGASGGSPSRLVCWGGRASRVIGRERIGVEASRAAVPRPTSRELRLVLLGRHHRPSWAGREALLEMRALGFAGARGPVERVALGERSCPDPGPVPGRPFSAEELLAAVARALR